MAKKRSTRGGRNTARKKKPAATDRRYTKCTPELTETFARAVENGASLMMAADIVGIARSTLSRWLKRGEEGDPAYEGFTRRVREALAKSCEPALRTMMEAAKAGDIRAAQWVLEKRYRNDPMMSGLFSHDLAPGLRGLLGEVRKEDEQEGGIKIVVSFEGEGER